MNRQSFIAPTKPKRRRKKLGLVMKKYKDGDIFRARRKMKSCPEGGMMQLMVKRGSYQMVNMKNGKYITVKGWEIVTNPKHADYKNGVNVFNHYFTHFGNVQ